MKLISSLLLLCLCPFFVSAEDGSAAGPEIALRKTIELEIKGKKGKTFKATSRVTIEQTYLTERSTSRKEFYIYKSSWEKVDKVKASLGGKKIDKKYIRKFYFDDEDTFNSELRCYQITFPGKIQIGETISYSYRKKHTDIALIPRVTILNANRLEELTIIVKHPKEMDVNIDTFFPREDIPHTREKLSRDKTRITFGPVDHFEKLPFYAFNDIHGTLMLRLTWDGEPINPTTPHDFLEWYGKLTDLRPTISDTAASKAELDFGNARTAGDTLGVINDFVRNNIRYISEVSHPHSIVPHNPSFVLSSRYGDCKDRANLVSAIARTYGLTVNMALTTARPHVDIEPVHVHLFNHVICYYNNNEKEIFFDPTAKYNPYGLLSEWLVSQKTLILDPDNPRFIDLPTPIDGPMIDMRIVGHIDSLTECRAEITLRYSHMTDALRAGAELANFKLRSALIYLTSTHLSRIFLDSLNYDSVAYDELTLIGKADLSDFVAGSGETKYIPQTPFAGFGNSILEREEDNWPIHMEDRGYFKLNIELAAPGLEAEPDSIGIDASGQTGFAAGVFNTDSGTVRLEYEIHMLEKQIPAESKRAFIEFCRSYLNMKSEMFVLKVEGD